MSVFRDRVVELRRVPARALKRHALNWRSHPPEQQAALQAALEQVGFAGALLARENEAGELELIDGHLRADLLPDQETPVLVLDVSAEEADQLLATHDAITALATINQAKFDALRAQLATRSPVLRETLAERHATPATTRAAVAGREQIDPDANERSQRQRRSRPTTIPETYELVVACADENDQRRLYERLAAEGYACRVLSL